MQGLCRKLGKAKSYERTRIDIFFGERGGGEVDHDTRNGTFFNQFHFFSPGVHTILNFDNFYTVIFSVLR